MAQVRLDQMTRRFPSGIAVEEISFTVPNGEFWVLVGASGCGKSTILRTIAGLDPVTSGNIYLGDRRVNDLPARQRDVAMVFQNYALYPHMTVAQNIGFGLKMRRVDASVRQARVETVARSLNLSHLLDRKPGQLSGGQQQRVALGRAIARQPQVFLLDEPLSNLDAQLRDDMRAELKQLHQQFGITTLYVTHDQVEAMTLADQIVVLHQGRIEQTGTPQSIYADPVNERVATFLGSPPMNILPVRIQDASLWLGDRALELPQAGRSCLATTLSSAHLGIRPEHLRVVAPDAGLLHAEVQVVEPLGRETLIRCGLDTDPSTLLHLHVAPDLHPQPGDRLPLSFAMSQVLLFDATTGDRLDRPR